MAKNKLTFEKDEKKSIIIALIVSAVVILSFVLAFIAIQKRRAGNVQVESATDVENVNEVQYSETGAIIVKNQDELDIALVDESITAILFQTEDEASIEIPKGDYSAIDITIDSPYAEVTNYGAFNSITILQVSANTWTEGADGNDIIINAPSSHLVVPSGAEVLCITNQMAGSTLAVECTGNINTLNLNADDSIASVKVDGNVNSIFVNGLTYLTLSGTKTGITSVDTGYNAEGSMISASIPVDMLMHSGATVNLDAGAELSELTVYDTWVGVTCTNDTTEQVIIHPSEGDDIKVEPGETYELSTSDSASSTSSSTTSSSTSNSSSSQSSSSSSSSTTKKSSYTSTTTTTNTNTNTNTNTSKEPTTSVTTTTTDKNTNTTTNKDSDKKVGELQNAINDLKDKLKDLQNKNDDLKKEIDTIKVSKIVTSFDPVAYCYDVSSPGNKPVVSEVEIRSWLTAKVAKVNGRLASGDKVEYEVEKWVFDTDKSEDYTLVYKAVLVDKAEYFKGDTAEATAMIYVGDSRNLTYRNKCDSLAQYITIQSPLEGNAVAITEGGLADDLFYAINDGGVSGVSSKKLLVDFTFHFFDTTTGEHLGTETDQGSNLSHDGATTVLRRKARLATIDATEHPSVSVITKVLITEKSDRVTEADKKPVYVIVVGGAMVKNTAPSPSKIKQPTFLILGIGGDGLVTSEQELNATLNDSSTYDLTKAPGFEADLLASRYVVYLIDGGYIDTTK